MKKLQWATLIGVEGGMRSWARVVHDKARRIGAKTYPCNLRPWTIKTVGENLKNAFDN